MKINKFKNIFIFIMSCFFVLSTSLLLYSCSNANNQSQKPSFPLPDNLDPNPGTTNSGIITDGFKTTIELLNLEPNIDLSTLSNSTLTNQLQKNPGYEKMNIEIQNGSNQKEGLLLIRLFGLYNNHSYDQIIKLTGFNKHLINSTYSFGEIKFNKELWFNNNQPLSDVSNGLIFSDNKDLLIELFCETNVKFNINGVESFNTLNNLPNLIKIESISINNTGTQNELNITFKKELKEYVNGNWVIVEQDSIIRKNTTSNSVFVIPSFNDLKQYIIDSLLLDKEALKKYYASYFYGDYLYNIKNGSYITNILDFFTNWNELINKYKPIYFPNKTLTLIMYDDHSMNVSDINHSISFNVSLIDQEYPENKIISREFSFNGFKNINDLNQTIVANDFYLKENTSFAQQIKNTYREQIDQALNNNTNTSVINLPSSLTNLYNYETIDGVWINNLNKTYYSMQIFNNNFSVIENGNSITPNTLNANTSLFTITNEFDTFFIKNILFSKTNNLDIKFQKHPSRDAINIDINTEIEILLEGDVLTQPANIHITFNASDLNINDNNKKEKLINNLAIKLNDINATDARIDVSNLNLTSSEIFDTWSWFINNMYALNTNYRISTKSSIPEMFIIKNTNGFITHITLQTTAHEANLLRDNNDQIINLIKQFLKYAPNNTHSYSYVYWIYQKIVDWMSYKTNINAHLFYGGITREGVCEAYAKLANVIFSCFNIESRFQIGTLKTNQDDLSKGPHVWNKYKIGDYWFNIDFTSADTSQGISSLSQSAPTSNYLAFNNSNYTSKREYFKNWYEPFIETTYDISTMATYIPFNRNSERIRKAVINDKWYFFEKESKNLYCANYDGSEKEVILTLNSNNFINNGIWQLGNRIYFADINKDNKYVINYYDVLSKQLNIAYQSNNIFYEFIIDENNQIIVRTDTGNITVDVNYDYNFLNTNDIYGLKANLEINKLWFSKLIIGNNTSNISSNDYMFYFNEIVEATNIKTFDQSIYNKVINFQKNVSSKIVK